MDRLAEIHFFGIKEPGDDDDGGGFNGGFDALGPASGMASSAPRAAARALQAARERTHPARDWVGLFRFRPGLKPAAAKRLSNQASGG